MSWRFLCSRIHFLLIASLLVLSPLLQMESAMAEELQIEILTEGDGDTAVSGMRVTVHYEGRLTDGTVFDSSYSRGQPFGFTLGAGQVIRGWEEGVAGMKIGEKRRLTIPSELGYGERGAGATIPPNATLVFEVELIALAEATVLNQASPDDLKQAMADGVIVIDIRREEEWRETGIIEGAHTITAFTEQGGLHPEFQQKFFSLVTGPDVPVMLYCRTGSRTTSLGNALIDQVGFGDVTHLSEGIVGWLENSHPVVPYQE